MIKRITDLDGLFLRDDFTFNPETEIGLDVIPAQGFILPKWNGTEWIEGGVKSTEIIVPIPTVEEKIELLAEKVQTLEEIVL
jgi:hypothetical protein